MATVNVLEPLQPPFMSTNSRHRYSDGAVYRIPDVIRHGLRRVQSSPQNLFFDTLPQSREVCVEINWVGGQVERVFAWSSDTIGDVKKQCGVFDDNEEVCLFVEGQEVVDEDVVGWYTRKGSNCLSLQADYTLRCNMFEPKANDVRKVLPSSALTLALGNEVTPQGSPFIPTPIPLHSECSGQLCVKGKVVCEDDKPVVSCVDSGAVHLFVHKQLLNCEISSRKSFELTVDSSQSVGSFKRQVAAAHGLENGMHRLLLDGQELHQGRSLKEYGVNKGSVVQLVPLQAEEGLDKFPNGSPTLANPNHQLFQSFAKAQEGLASGNFPELASSGSGGSYFMKSAGGANVAVFKPEDEEPMALHNPKGMSSSSSDLSSSSGLRKGIRPGEGAVREVIAFLIDHQHFSGVPPTALVNLVAHGLDDCLKVGSLQDFVEADYDCEERGTWAFPTSEVHKICVLDIRLANTDRNAGNILAKQDPVTSAWKLTPIDHGYCLPDSFEDISFEWMYWPQAEKPFDSDTKRYIQTLDSDLDLNLMRQHNLHVRPECERVFRVCTMLLKMAAVCGHSPYDIARIICREDFTQSPIEQMDAKARFECELEQGHNFSVASYMVKMEELMGSYLENYSEDTLLDGLS